MKTVVDQLSAGMGLTSYESRLYTALTAHGPLLVAKLATVAKIPRTAVYPPLNSLLEKGFVSKTGFGKRIYYSASPPEMLRSIFEQKRISIDSAIALLNESRRVNASEIRLDAVLYTGSEGIKSGGLLFLEETKEKIWHSFENLTNITDTVGVSFEESYIKERVKKKIHSKMLLSAQEESPFVRRVLKDDKKQLRESIILSPHSYPLETTIVATKGLLLLIQPHTNPYALLIRSPHLAASVISIHKCIWDRYKV